MTDVLLRVASNPPARRVVEAFRLPIPLPHTLMRASGPWKRRELAGHVVAVVRFTTTAIAEPFAAMLAESGARMCVLGGKHLAPVFERAGEAYGTQVTVGTDAIFDRIIFDATDVASPADVRALYDDLHRLVPRMLASGRLVVLAPPSDARDPLAAAASTALEGFVRSAAKELGRRGTTAQLVEIAPGAEERAAAITRFLLSTRSAFVTAQPIHASLAATGDDLAYADALHRKVAIVTGAARGIGEATARRLADEGAHVICVDRPADETVLAYVANAVRGSMMPIDVADPLAAQRIAEHVRTHHGGVDIVVHNAGITRDRTLAKMSAVEWNQVLDINLVAVTQITSALLPLMRDHGRVICLSSVAGIAGNVGQTNYAASKAGLIGYVRALAKQVANRGITANAVAPGFIETRMTAAIPIMVREAARRLSALGQGGLPSDVAELITFLAQPASAGITGSVLRVCGGALIGA